MIVGFSVVEVLLASTMFGLMVTALAGAIIFGQVSQATGGTRSRAVAVAEEGIEAVRNIRDASYANLSDGTFGVAQASNQWVLSGVSDVNDIFTRQVTISSSGASRKAITSTVSWPEGGSTDQVSATTELTNWMASIAAATKSWALATQLGIYDANGSNDGFKVATQGNYAYLIRSDGAPNFFVIDISTPATSTLVGSATLAGGPTNVAVSGDYAYVTNGMNSAELQIIYIGVPGAPTQVATYNAAGNSDGRAVYISGNYAYLVRAANKTNNEFVALDVSIPAVPSRVGWYSLNVDMNDVYVNGADVYIATGSDTQEIIKITDALTGEATAVTSFNLTGATDATAIAGFGNTLFVGQGTALRVMNDVTSQLGTVTASGVINSIALKNDNAYAFLGTAASAAEFQVVSVSASGSPSIVKTLDVGGGSTTLTGVAYNPTLDVVPAAGNSDTQELTVFGPG